MRGVIKKVFEGCLRYSRIEVILLKAENKLRVFISLHNDFQEDEWNFC